MNYHHFLAIFLIFLTGFGPHLPVCYAETNSEPLYTRPLNVPARSNAEYYSASPDSALVIPVNIWGNVREPGLHFLPIGSNLHQSVSAAGGPSDSADLSSIRILRSGKSTYADLLGPKSPPVQANDYVFVDRTYKADLPMWFAGLSAVVSIVTLYYVVKPVKK